MAGIEAYPTSLPSVKSFLEGAKRKLARPVRPKNHCPLKRCRPAIADHVSNNSLSDLSFLLCSFSRFRFVFFFAVDEIMNLSLRDVFLSANTINIGKVTIYTDSLGVLAGDVSCAWPVPHFLSFFAHGVFLGQVFSGHPWYAYT